MDVVIQMDALQPGDFLQTDAAPPDAAAPPNAAAQVATRTIHCGEPWFSHIRSGRKPVEGRKASPAWAPISPGDLLVFYNADHDDSRQRHFYARVTGITRYEGPGALRRFLEGETLARALPGVGTIAEGEAIYLQWSTAEEIDRYGMLGVQVAVCT